MTAGLERIEKESSWPVLIQHSAVAPNPAHPDRVSWIPGDLVANQN